LSDVLLVCATEDSSNLRLGPACQREFLLRREFRVGHLLPVGTNGVGKEVFVRGNSRHVRSVLVEAALEQMLYDRLDGRKLRREVELDRTARDACSFGDRLDRRVGIPQFNQAIESSLEEAKPSRTRFLGSPAPALRIGCN
jgi:hypothetical protein